LGQQTHRVRRLGQSGYCYFARPLDRADGRGHFSLQIIDLAAALAPVMEENLVMQRIHSLLRKAPSRIRQKFAEIVAIAAASLPSAGA
jgi:hypothetical protein